MAHIKELIKAQKDITLCFVGDSITNGTNFCRREETYVAKFAALFAAHFKNYTVNRYDGIVKDELSPMKEWDGPVLVSLGKCGNADIIKNGVGGNTIERALARKADFCGRLANGKRADVYFLMFGINDALKSDPNKYVTPEVFYENYKRLIFEIREQNPDVLVIIMSATTSNETIDEYCKKAALMAKEEKLPFIDLYALWNEHFDANADNCGHGDWLKSDPWHPSPKGSEQIARYVFSEFINIIK